MSWFDVERALEDLKKVMVDGYGFASAKRLLIEAKKRLLEDDYTGCLKLLEKAKSEAERERRIASDVRRICESRGPELKSICEEVVIRVRAGDLDSAEVLLERLKGMPPAVVVERKSRWDEELARVEEWLAKLEELYRKGEVSEKVYRKLREEYERERERLRGLS